MFDEKEYKKRWAKNNPEKCREYKKRWAKNNPEKVEKRIKRWRKEYPEKIKKIRERYRKNHPEGDKQYQKNNREKIREQHRQYANLKRKINLKFSLNHNITNAIYRSLKNNKAGYHWGSLVGYTLTDLITRLKKTMPEGYTWRDYLTGELHIDHIIPISAFNFTRPEHTDFKRCWALDNLRLLPAKENRIKQDKLDRPFQPALKM